MPIPAYASCCTRKNGTIVLAWTQGRDLVFSENFPNQGPTLARRDLDNPALFLDIAADDSRVCAVWQDHELDECIVLIQGASFLPGRRLGTAHGTMSVAARLHPDTQLFHVWWLEQVVRLDAQGREVKTTEQLGHWIEGVGSKLTSLPPHLAWDAVKREGGTSQGIRDVEFVDGEFRVRFMDDERSRFV